MLKFFRNLTLVTALALPPAALACETPITPTFREELARAKHVFIFQLVSLDLTRPYESMEVVGKIKLESTLKGRGKKFRRLQYTAYWCHELQLMVGHYYIAATSQDGSVLKLISGDRSIIDLGHDFQTNNRARRNTIQWHVANYLNGVPLPASFRDEDYTYRTSGVSGPPPPKPPDMQ